MLLDGLETCISYSVHDENVPFMSVMSMMQDCSYPYPSEEVDMGEGTCELNCKTHIELTEEIADLMEEIEIEDADTENPNENNENSLLYKEARVTVGESLLLIMTFSMRHKLSMIATADLLKLIELHCPSSNLAVSEMRKFRQYFKHLNHPIKKHFSCPNPKCQVYISSEKPKENDVCQICGERQSENSFFIEVPVEDQLQTILSRKFYK